MPFIYLVFIAVWLAATKYRVIHHFMTIAHHEEIPKGTMMSILKDVSDKTGIAVGQLKEMLNEE